MESKVTVKLQYLNEVRRFSCDPTASFIVHYADTIAKTKAIFPNLSTSDNFQLTWKDDENDSICINSDEELAEAVRLLSSHNKGIVKFIVEQPSTSNVPSNNSNSNSSSTIHYGVSCDACNQCPIIGTRYKCTVRRDYDLCTKCEASPSHAQPYPMVKIYSASSPLSPRLTRIIDFGPGLRQGDVMRSGMGCQFPCTFTTGATSGTAGTNGGRSASGRCGMRGMRGGPRCGRGQQQQRKNRGSKGSAESTESSGAFGADLSNMCNINITPDIVKTFIQELGLGENVDAVSLLDIVDAITAASAESAASSDSNATPGSGGAGDKLPAKTNAAMEVLLNILGGGLSGGVVSTSPCCAKLATAASSCSAACAARNLDQSNSSSSSSSSSSSTASCNEKDNNAGINEDDASTFSSTLSLEEQYNIIVADILQTDADADADAENISLSTSCTRANDGVDDNVNDGATTDGANDTANGDVAAASTDATTTTAVPSMVDVDDSEVYISGLRSPEEEEWAAELQTLQAMGFYDTPTLLALLKEHVRVPCSIPAGGDGQLSTRSLERVIDALMM